jgi:hypothetical protein
VHFGPLLISEFGGVYFFKIVEVKTIELKLIIFFDDLFETRHEIVSNIIDILFEGVGG